MAVQHLRHRVQLHPMGGAQPPILPGAAQPGSEELDAGEARQDPRRYPRLLQQRQQALGPRVKARVAAEDHAGRLLLGCLEQVQDLLSAYGGHFSRTVFRQMFQETLRA